MTSPLTKTAATLGASVLAAGLATVALGTSAVAADLTTCNALASTIQVTARAPGDRVVGTDGDDVITIAVAGDFPLIVDAAAGNDSICLLAMPREVSLIGNLGDDYISTVGVTGEVRTTLDVGYDTPQPPGANTFVGGEGRDLVSSGGGNDTISTGGGSDSVSFVGAGAVIDLGAGDDRFGIGDGAVAPTRTVQGGPGTDTFGVSGRNGGAGSIDDVTRTASVDGRTATYDGFENFGMGGNLDVTFRGSEASERLTLDAFPDERLVADVDMGGGDDTLVHSTGYTGALRGGAGTNTLIAPRTASDVPNSASTPSITIDLARERFAIRNHGGGTISDFANVEVDSYRSVSIAGTGADETFTLTGCRVVAKGRGGSDTVNAKPYREKGNGKDPDRCGGRYSLTAGGGQGKDTIKGSRGADRLSGDKGADVLKGRGGNDVLRGGGGSDELVGQGGRDTAYGQGGRDTCRSERRSTCER